MLEPAVTLTDFVLFILNAWFAVRLRGEGLLRHNFVLFFAAIGATALLGALTHGFFPTVTFAGVVLWRATMLVVGIVSSAAFLIAVRLLLPSANAIYVRLFAVAAFVFYAVVVLFVKWTFAMALAFYVPASLVLLCGFLRQLPRAPRPASLGVFGLIFTFVAAYVQHEKIAVHAIYFDHNATYHLVQAIGLLLIYFAARNLVAAESEA